jgi:hypothetical protein
LVRWQNVCLCVEVEQETKPDKGERPATQPLASSPGLSPDTVAGPRGESRTVSAL